MLTKSKLLRPLALGAFAVALVSAPFVTSAQAGGDHKHDRYEHWIDKKKHKAKAHRRMHKAGVRHHHHYKEERRHARKHRRIRQAWKHGHDHHRGHKRPVKVIHKVVKVEQAPRYTAQERLIHSLIEAVLAANVAPHYR